MCIEKGHSTPGQYHIILCLENAMRDMCIEKGQYSSIPDIILCLENAMRDVCIEKGHSTPGQYSRHHPMSRERHARHVYRKRTFNARSVFQTSSYV